MRQRWGLVAWVVVGVAGLASLSLPVPALPSNSRGPRGFTTPPVSSTLRFGQTFEMTADGLDGITLYPVSDGVPSGDIQLSLVDITPPGNGTVVRSAVVTAAEMIRDS